MPSGERTYVQCADGRRRVHRCATHRSPSQATSIGGVEHDAARWRAARLRRSAGAEVHAGGGALVAARPGRDRAREERAEQVGQFQVGETITVETPERQEACPARRRLRARHQRGARDVRRTMVVGYVSMDTLTDLDEPDKFNHLALTVLDGALTRSPRRAASQRDVRDEAIEPAGRSGAQTSTCPSPAATSSATSSRRSRCCCLRSACSRSRSPASL